MPAPPLARRRPLALAVALLLLVPLAPALAATDAETYVPLRGSVAPFAIETPDLGDAPAEQPLHVVVALRLVDEETLLALADATPRVVLSHDEVVAQFSPSESVVHDVTGWLETRGLQVARVSADRTLLEIDTTVGQAAAAFQVPLRLYEVGEHVVHANPSDPLVPMRLAPVIQAVVGLTGVPLTTLHRLPAPVPDAGSGDNGAPPYTAHDLRNAYDVNDILAGGDDGAGLAIGITGWGGPSQTSFDQYNAYHGLPTSTLRYRAQDGGTSCGTSAQLEWDMDVQMEHAMAPGAELWTYCAKSAQISDMLVNIGNVVNDNRLAVISQSWGVCEYYVSSTTASSYETKFAQGSAQGQAFFTASGDSGSRECLRTNTNNNRISPSWPATAPHTVSVGGTAMRMIGDAWSSEATWNNCAPCSDGTYHASGGGNSALYGRPSWQDRPDGYAGRASPDVAGVADPYTGVRVRSGGWWYQVGGTSASSPIWGGYWAAVVDGAGERLGNAGQLLWDAARTTDYPTLFHDVTSGNNGDYAAGAGYDFPTGWGSMRGLALHQTLTGVLRAPQNVAAEGGDGSITLTWQTPLGAEGVTGYRIYRGTGPDALAHLSDVGTVLTYVDGGHGPSVTYHYAVRALASGEEGRLSDVVAATTWGVPSAPTNASAVAGPGNGDLTFSWSAPLEEGPGVTGYRVYGATGLGVGPSNDTSLAARLVGGERFVLQMDADDHHVPSAGKTNDASGHGLHGELSNVVLEPGRFGDALRFSGAHSYVRVHETLSMPEGSLMMWFRLDEIGPGSHRLLYKQDPGVTNALVLYLDLTQTVPLIGFTANQGTATMSAPLNAALGEWVHVAATWGPAGERFYLNGERVASNDDTTGVTHSYTHTMFGNSPNDVSTGGFRGLIDEVREHTVQLDDMTVQSLMMQPYHGERVTEYVLLHETTATTFVESGLAADEVRHYRASALNKHGEGPLAAAVSAQTFPGPYDSPLDVRVTAPAEGTLDLTWAPPAQTTGKLTGYRVHRGPSADALVPLVDLGDVLSYRDAGLANGTTYHYALSALTTEGEGGLSATVSQRTWGPPLTAPEVNARSGPSAGEITLDWTEVADDGGSAVTSYRVHLVPSGEPPVPIAETELRTWTDRGLSAGTSRTYLVTAWNAYGEGPASETATGVTFRTPQPPQSVAATPGPGAGTLHVAWQPPADDGGLPVTSYLVYAGSGTSPLALVANVTSRSYTESGLAENETRVYRVAAVTDAGEGEPGPAVSAQTFARPYAPYDVGIAAGPGAGVLRIDWQAPHDGGLPILAYRVYGGNESDALELIVETTETQAREDGLDVGQERHYAVSAVNELGEGPLSPVASGIAPDVPQPPRALRAVYSSTLRTVLTWSPSPDANGPAAVHTYRIYRGTSPTSLEPLTDLRLPVVQLRYEDRTCPMLVTCHYHVTAIGVAGESPPSNAVDSIGLSLGVGTAGRPSDDPRDVPRLLGHERLVLQMDLDDDGWPVDGATRDSSPMQNHAFTRSVTLEPGRHGGGYRFTGTEQYLRASASRTSNLAEGTLMLWVNFDELAPSFTQLVHQARPGSYTELSLAVDLDGCVVFSTSQSSSTPLRACDAPIAPGAWTHLALTWGASGKRVYVDGELVAQDRDRTGIRNNALYLDVGGDANNHANTGLRATLDELRVYDLALVEGEIRSLMVAPYAE